MARVLFAHAHLLRFDAKHHAIGKPYPPLATLLAAAYARSLGHEVSLFDPTLEEDLAGFSSALARRPDAVVLYDDSFNWFTKLCLSRMRDGAASLLSLARAAGIPALVAGHDAADAPERYLAAGADLVLLGEGEHTLGEALAELPRWREHTPGREALLGVPGLALRYRGMLRRTAPRALSRDLDALPLPAWDLAEVERYRAFWRARHGYFSLNLATTRGCPYKCNWCAKPVYGNTYQTRSPEGVLSELRLLRARFAPEHLWFCDDILGLKPRWLEAFAAGVEREGLRTPFLCQTRADLMSDDAVRALRRAGAQEVWLGAESGSQRVLDAMEKGLEVGETREAVRRLRREGVRVGLFLQFGYDGEGWAELEQTRSLVRELLPDDIGISVSYPLPGTRYYERVAAQLGDKRNWRQSSDLDPLVPRPFSQRFYQTLSRAVHSELRTRRGAAALRALLRGQRRADPRTLRAVGELRFAAPWLLEQGRLELERRRL